MYSIQIKLCFLTRPEVSTEEIDSRTTSKSSNETTAFTTQSPAGTSSSMLVDILTTSYRQSMSTTRGVLTTENAEGTEAVDSFTHFSYDTTTTETSASTNTDKTAFYQSQSSTVGKASQTFPTTAQISTALPQQSSTAGNFRSTMQQTTESTTRSLSHNTSSSSEGMVESTEQVTSVSNRHSPSDIVTFTSTENIKSAEPSTFETNTFSSVNTTNSSEAIFSPPYSKSFSSSVATPEFVEKIDKETSSSALSPTTEILDSSTTISATEQISTISDNSSINKDVRTSTKAFYNFSTTSANATTSTSKVIHTSSTTDQSGSTAVYTSTSSSTTSTGGKFQVV